MRASETASADPAMRLVPDQGAAPGERPSPITAVILTHNEERNLPRCLESLVGWIDEVMVVDSGSTDATLAIAERFRCRVVQHPFETHARQWGWVLRKPRLPERVAAGPGRGPAGEPGARAGDPSRVRRRGRIA